MTAQPFRCFRATGRGYRCSDPGPMRPAWTPEEDAKLADITSLGICVQAWPVQFPARRFGDVAERRIELALKSPPLL